MIKEYRKKLGITQEQLAEKLDLSWRQIQRIEKNEYETKISTLIRIIKTLNIPDKEIIKYLKRNNFRRSLTAYYFYSSLFSSSSNTLFSIPSFSFSFVTSFLHLHSSSSS